MMKFLISTLFVLPIVLALLTIRPGSSQAPENTPQSKPIIPYYHGKTFHDILKNEYYVDKTNLLKILLEEDDAEMEKTNLITRPSGFGKTTNLQMIAAFCEIKVDPITGSPIANETDNYKLFNKTHVFGKLAISNDETFMRDHLGRYPVIYLDFKNATPVSSIEDILANCRKALHNAYEPHEYLSRSPKLRDDEKLAVQNWTSKVTYDQINEEDVLQGLKSLIRYLYAHFNRKVVVLIDEYDKIIEKMLQSAIETENEIATILSPFMRMLHYGLIKTRENLKISVITGVTNFGSAGMSPYISMNRYLFGRKDKVWPYYGFTSQEVQDLLDRSPFKSNNSVKEQVVQSYDGYSVDGQHIFTPVSIAGFLTVCKIGPYWSKEGNKSISQFWKALRVLEVRKLMMDLIDNKTIVIENINIMRVYHVLWLKEIIESEHVASTITHKSSTFFNFMLDLGYLKINSANSTHLEVDIPNNEVREEITQFLKLYELNTNS
ncbi:uncharacterized protein LOC135848000 [Planococcus citri]|uniref:uncharacterized protein LOC135848000 n=1 Tax=Planococcus citri TaxID=170843 RepID=UPI0031F90213